MNSKNWIRFARFGAPVIAALALGLITAKTVSADAAIVIKDNGSCGMPGSDPDGNIIFGGIGQVTTEVENNNKVMVKCKGTGLTTGRAGALPDPPPFRPADAGRGRCQPPLSAQWNSEPIVIPPSSIVFHLRSQSPARSFAEARDP